MILPRQHKTWLQFYEFLDCQNALSKPRVVITCEIDGKTVKNEYWTADIEKKVLEELLADRVYFNEAIEAFKEIDTILYQLGHNDVSPLRVFMRKVKKIIYAQSIS